VLRQLGRYKESFHLTEEILEKSQTILGEGDSLTLFLRNSFGADLRAQGDFGRARELDLETRTLLEANFGPRHPRTLRLLSGLALDYGLNSDYTTAKDLYQYVFPLINQREAEAAPSDVLSTWVGLAWTLRLLGEYRNALDVLQEARDYAQEALGAEHIGTLRCTNAYTIVCRKFPESRVEALETCQSTFEMSRRLFGESHPDTLAAGISLSNLLRTISEDYHAEALAQAEDTVARYPAAYGPDHPYNYGCIGNVALLKRVIGDAGAARELNTQALAGLEATLGRDHYYTLTVATNLASDLAALGHLGEARELGEDTLSRLTALMGADHPGTLGCAANLALDIIATSDEAAGRALQDQTAARYRRSLGEQNPDAMVALAGGRLDPDFDPPPI
jgi:tetratricopeptide (TPR) repeat protein